MNQVIPTMLVGSYPQPAWLVNRDVLLGNAPPRVRMRDVWCPGPETLQEAQDDACLLALRDQERAGIDIVSDGECRRESYFSHFANALGGIDINNPGEMPGRTGKPTSVPRVTGPITRTTGVQVGDVAFLRQQTDRPIKVTIPGAFTMARMAKDEFYGDQGRLIDAYAAVLNAVIQEMKAAGADIIQIDEPHMQAHPEDARRYGVDAINQAFDGVPGITIVHVCFGYAYVVRDKPSGYSFLAELDACDATAISIEAAQPRLDPSIIDRLPSKQIVYGVIDLGTDDVETPELVADRLRGAVRHAGPGRIIAAPDCGMKYLTRQVACGKLAALADGAAIVRREVEGN
ncbi:MAG: uroporphyrinogen decarboxylase family protein [Minwuia sp.]|nr:uroporphyrinogen decarboxylase family protein [Minwuia sp.]